MSHGIASLADAVLYIVSIEPASGHVLRFGRDDIHAVKALNCDLLVRCGGNFLVAIYNNIQEFTLNTPYSNRLCRFPKAGDSLSYLAGSCRRQS